MIGAAIKKDVQILLRDRSALISLFALPIVFMAVFGSMFSGGGRPDRPGTVAVFAPGGAARAQEAVRSIEESGQFQVRREASAGAVRALVAGEKVTAGLVFPPDFDPFGGVLAELVIDTAAPALVRGPLEGALGGLVAQSLVGGAVPRTLVATSPPGLREPLEGASPFQISVPGNAVLFGFFLALTVGISFLEERRSGTFRRLLAAPVRRSTVLVAKLVPYYLVGLAQMALLFGLGALAFGMRVGGSAIALVLLTCAVVFAAVSKLVLQWSS